MEIRTTQLANLELREQANQPNQVTGYVAYWNVPSVIRDRSGRTFKESYAPNCFDVGDECFGLISHEIRSILNTKTAGTLITSSDSKGLRFEMTLPNTTLGRDTYENVKNGNYKGASAGFDVIKDKWTFGKEPSVEILKASLKEISLTPNPSHKTSLSVRAMPLFDLTHHKIRLYKLLLLED